MTTNKTLDNSAYWLTVFGAKSAADIVNQHDLRGQSETDLRDFLDASEVGAAEMDGDFRRALGGGEYSAAYDAALADLVAAAAA